MSSAAEPTFEQLIDAVFDPLFGYALRMAGNRPDAEDLLQESIYRALRGFRGFRPGTNFKAWMFRIVTNTFISRKRSERRAPQALSSPEEVVERPAPGEAALADPLDTQAWDELLGQALSDEVRQALLDLPEDFRAPLLLFCVGELRYREIAEALDLPVGTVMSRLFRARQRMRASLEEHARTRGVPLAEEAL
ncbi:MAG: sigma-70 family RNA polymerase sigma factor [Planctomycetota bacterium]